MFPHNNDVRLVFTSSLFVVRVVMPLFVFVYIVQHILCCGFCIVCLRLVLYLPNGASFSGLSILDRL